MAGVTCFLASRRRRLHHRPDDLRRRRPDPVPELRDAVVVGVTTRPSRGSARHARPRGRGQAPRGARRSSARAGCTTSAACSTRPSRCSRAATSARRSSRPRTTPTAGGVGENRVNWITEQVVRHDAARHAPRRAQPPADRRPRLQRLDASPSSPATAGVKRLGVETVPQIVTRGWLVDVAAAGPGDVIGVDDLAGIDPAPGDAVLFHTGWGAHWDDPERYLVRRARARAARSPHWLAERGVALTGCDTWSYGPVPGRGPRAAVRGAADPQRPPRRLRRREPRPGGARRRRRARVRPGPHPPKLRGATGAWTSPDRPRLRRTRHASTTT